MPMIKHEIKKCPRCNAMFECKLNNVAHCQCSEVELSSATRNYLKKTEYDCLCDKCLSELNQLVHLTDTHHFPQPGEWMIENLHYYKENGFWVFTEFYHILRGYCCKSGCRHCAYGFKKIT